MGCAERPPPRGERTCVTRVQLGEAEAEVVGATQATAASVERTGEGRVWDETRGELATAPTVQSAPRTETAVLREVRRGRASSRRQWKDQTRRHQATRQLCRHRWRLVPRPAR